MEIVDSKDADKGFWYEYPRPVLAVDALVFGVLTDCDELCVFLQRDNESIDTWSLAGRWMHTKDKKDTSVSEEENWTLEQTLQSALRREWKVVHYLVKNGMGETGLPQMEPKITELTYNVEWNEDLAVQLNAKDRPGRDTRGIRVISIPYMSLVSVKDPIPSNLGGVNPMEGVAQWVPISKINRDDKRKVAGKYNLSHDHAEILSDGLNKLGSTLRMRPLGRSLLPEEFEMQDLIRIYTLCLNQFNQSIDRSNLRKLLIDRGVVEDSENKGIQQRTKKSGGACKFRFTKKYDEYLKLNNFGFNPGGTKV